MAKLSEVIIKLSKISKMKNMNEEELLTFIEDREKCKISPRLKKRYDVTEDLINGNVCYVLSPKEEKSDKAVLFVHGGAYILDMDSYHWRAVDGIIKKTKATVYVPVYPLAPDHAHEETEEMMKALYDKMLKKHNDISFIGDSAGGQIAIKLASESEVKPNKLILVSPLIYLNPDKDLINEMRGYEKRDLMLSVNFISIVSRWWTENKEYAYGDVSLLKNVSIFIGTEEILYPQAMLFAKQVKNCKIYEGKGEMHTWPYIPGEKECVEGFNRICEEVRL